MAVCGCECVRVFDSFPTIIINQQQLITVAEERLIGRLIAVASFILSYAFVLDRCDFGGLVKVARIALVAVASQAIQPSPFRFTRRMLQSHRHDAHRHDARRLLVR